MKDGVVLVDPVHTGQVIHIKEVHASLHKAVDGIVVVKDGLLLLVPLGLSRQQAYVVDPIVSRLEPDYLEVFVAQFVDKRLIARHLVARGGNVPEDVGVDASHVVQGEFLPLVLVFFCK